jgi:hypothetical protein
MLHPFRSEFSRYNPTMLQLAAIALVASGLLSAAAVVSFSWSVAMAKSLLPCAIAAAAVGAMAAVLAGGLGGVAAWAFFFACAACGCDATAARNLFTRPPRWVHRFVIYAGYGATFAAMGAAGLWLETWAVSGRLAAAFFVGAYVVGSAGIFLAKTLTVRLIAKTMPEYHASLAADQHGYDGHG